MSVALPLVARHAAAPQMQDRICAPRTPRFGELAQRLLTEQLAFRCGGATQNQITGGKRIRMRQGAHRDVLRGPVADTIESRPRVDESIERLFGRETYPAVQHGTRDAANAG